MGQQLDLNDLVLTKEPELDLKAFVQATELGNPAFSVDQSTRAARAPVSMSPDEEQAFINDRSLVSFATGVSASKRWDVLDSILFAQLAADKKYELHTDTFEWYSRYHEVLRTLGWVTETNLFANKEIQNSAMEVKDEIVAILSAAFGGIAIAPLVLKVLESIKKLGDKDGNIIAFKKSTTKDEKGAFQIAYAMETDGLVTMLSGIFKITATNVLTQVLFFKSSKDFTGVSYNVSKNTFQETAFSSVREMVIEKLGTRRRSAVAELELP